MNVPFTVQYCNLHYYLPEHFRHVYYSQAAQTLCPIFWPLGWLRLLMCLFCLKFKLNTGSVVGCDWLDQVGYYGDRIVTACCKWNLCSFMYMQMFRFFFVEEQAKQYGDVNLTVQSPNSMAWLICSNLPKPRGTRWCNWLRHCAVSREVAGPILNGVIGIFD